MITISVLDEKLAIKSNTMKFVHDRKVRIIWLETKKLALLASNVHPYMFIYCISLLQ